MFSGRTQKRRRRAGVLRWVQELMAATSRRLCDLADGDESDILRSRRCREGSRLSQTCECVTVSYQNIGITRKTSDWGMLCQYPGMPVVRAVLVQRPFWTGVRPRWQLYPRRKPVAGIAGTTVEGDYVNTWLPHPKKNPTQVTKDLDTVTG